MYRVCSNRWLDSYTILPLLAFAALGWSHIARADAVLDGLIFATGADAVGCVWAGGKKVVEDGRHRLRNQARDAFNDAVRRLVP